MDDDVEAQVKAFREQLDRGSQALDEVAPGVAHARLIEDEELELLLESFIRARRAGGEPDPTVDECMRLVRLVEAARTIEAMVGLAVKGLIYIDLDGNDLVAKRLHGGG